MRRRTIPYRRTLGRLGAAFAATVLFVAYAGVGAIPAYAQAIDLAAFATVDWSTENDEPPGIPPFAPAINGPELTLDESEYAAIVSPSNAVSGPDEVFEMSLLQVEPAIDDDFWGLTFGLQPDGAVALEGVPINGPPLNNNADWVFWTWKSRAQPIDQPSGPLSSLVNISGPVRTGLGLGRVQGLVAFDEFAHRIDDAATPGVLTPLQDAVAGSLGDPGEPVAPSDVNLPQPYKIDYESRPTICTRTRYSTAGVKVWANGELALDHTAAAPLPTGPWGLVFLAQDLGTYRVGRYLCAGDNDGDGVLDAADLDDDGDGIDDSVELPGGLEGDANSNNIPDFADFTLGTFNDANSDGIDDAADFDGDGIPNHFDLDSDGDGGPDSTDPQPLSTAACGDSDADGCDDCAINGEQTPGDDGLDTDGDGLCDSGGADTDLDGDGVENGEDAEPLNALVCADSESDGCDDCAINGEQTPGEDGLDTDGDGLCDSGGVDTDLDGDGVENSEDAEPLNALVCADSDADDCDDCAVAGQQTPGGDGLDTDGDGLCDSGGVDPDLDGDGVENSADTAPLTVLACADSDADGCDDCAVAGEPTPGGDGLDTDGDGLCDLGGADTDLDGDGVENSVDTAPLNALVCVDSDVDGCDDCAVHGEPTPGADGQDSDGDGLCDVGDPTPFERPGQGDAGMDAGRTLDASAPDAGAPIGALADAGDAGGEAAMGGSSGTSDSGMGGSAPGPDPGGFPDGGLVLTGDGNLPAVEIFDADGCTCALAGGRPDASRGPWSVLGLAATLAGMVGRRRLRRKRRAQAR